MVVQGQHQMRIGALILLLLFGVSVPIYAGQSTPLDSRLTEILNRSQSKDLHARETAFADLCNLWYEEKDASSQYGDIGGTGQFFFRHPEQAERVKLGLIRMLQIENNAMKEAPVGSLDEADGEYVFELTQTVSALKDDRAIPVLAESLPGSGVDLLQYGDKALGAVLSQLKNPDALVRATALEIAARILTSDNDESSRARLTTLVQASLKDPEPVVRRAATREVACLPDRKSFVPTLEQMAKSDSSKLPGKADDGGDGNEFYPVRFEARRTLSVIKNNQTCRN